MQLSADAPGWYADLQGALAIHAVVSRRAELPVFLLRWVEGEPLQWTDLTDPHYRPRPFHFEIHYGKRELRDAHYLECLARAREASDPVVAELFGFWDLFCALPVGDGEFFLYTGQFCREAPTWETLAEAWEAIAGRAPSPADPDFAHFVRMAIRLPVLDDELLAGWSEFIELYASLLARDRPRAERNATMARIEEISSGCLARLWPLTELVDDVVSPDKFQLPMWGYERHFSEWTQEAMGLSRLPTTAMALMPLDRRDDALDPVRALVRNAAVQRDCILFARELPDTAATRLQDYGVTLISSCRPGREAAVDRRELRERAETFRARIAERFGVASAVGIGPTQSPGSQLYESHREALLALHMCTQLEKKVLFFDEHGDRHPLRYSDLHAAAKELESALLSEKANEVKLESDRYVQIALRFSNERIEVLRSQFLATSFRLLELVEKRNPLHGESHERFAEELTSEIEAAQSQQQLISSFNSSLQRLALAFSRQWAGSGAMRMTSSLGFLRDNFAEPLSLPVVARRAGFSVPVFSRAFKEATGTSFLAYLRELRVDHAKKLLTSTAMTTEEVAAACGFSSPHHLIRSFKKVTGKTPGAYRREKKKQRASGIV